MIGGGGAVWTRPRPNDRTNYFDLKMPVTSVYDHKTYIYLSIYYLYTLLLLLCIRTCSQQLTKPIIRPFAID